MATPPAPVLRPTLGPVVCRWMESSLVHGPGDCYGRPYRLHPFLRRFIWRAYELHPDGSRVYDRAVLGVPKGNSKTEGAAAIALAELAGPVTFGGWSPSGKPIGVRRVSPDIPCAAASYEQADKVFGCAVAMVKEGPLVEFLEPYETEILIKNAPGRMYRVAAVAGTNDGGMPTFFVADEVHEWLGKKERVHVVISNGRAKRRDAWELNISTAGYDKQSLFGKMVSHGEAIAAGKATDPSFLFEYHSYKEPLDENGQKIELDFSDRDALAEAIRIANPASDSFVSIESRLQRATQIPEYEFRRYYLNQWVDAPEQWLPSGVLEAAADPHHGLPPDGADVVLFLDGSFNGQSTGIVGATVDERPHLFVLKAWEKGRDKIWKVSSEEIEAEIGRACERWSVLSVGMDKNRWPQTIENLEESGAPVVAWQCHLASRMVPACAQFYDAIARADGSDLSHDGDERLVAHVQNAVLKIDGRGPRIVKDHEDSDRNIDLAIAAVGAYDLAVRAAAGGDDDWRPQ